MAYSIITVVRGQKGMCPSESQGWTGAICHCFDSHCLRKVSKHTINMSRPRREYAYNKCIHNPYILEISLGTIVKGRPRTRWKRMGDKPTKTKTLQAAGVEKGVYPLPE